MLNVQSLNTAITRRGMTIEQFLQKCGMTKRKWYYWMQSKKPNSQVLEVIHRHLEPITEQESDEIFWNV